MSDKDFEEKAGGKWLQCFDASPEDEFPDAEESFWQGAEFARAYTQKEMQEKLEIFKDTWDKVASYVNGPEFNTPAWGLGIRCVDVLIKDHKQAKAEIKRLEGKLGKAFLQIEFLIEYYNAIDNFASLPEEKKNRLMNLVETLKEIEQGAQGLEG